MAGNPFELDLAAAAAGVSEAAVVDAVDELLARELVRTDRRASALSLPAPARAPRRLRGDRGGWRLGAHERCAEALLARGAGERRAHTTSSARRGRAISARSPSCAPRARTRRGCAGKRRRAGSATALRLLPQTAPVRTA